MQYFRDIICHLDDFTQVVKMTNHIGLWDIKLVQESPCAICWIWLYGLEYGFKIHGFRPTWPCLMVKVLATQVKFFFNHLVTLLWSIASLPFTRQIRLQHYSPVQTHKSQVSELDCYTFIYSAFISHTELSNAECVSTPTTLILPTAVHTLHNLNCATN